MKGKLISIGVVIAGLVLFKLAISQTYPTTSPLSSPKESLSETYTQKGLAVATFAGGCFWCIESTFEKVEGVIEAISGYSGGSTENPTYNEVGGGSTGHTETVQIYYDPKIVSYETLLYYFWRDIDPTDQQGQFVDRGSEYRPAIFYHDSQQKELAHKTKDELEASNRFTRPINTEIILFEKFWEAESHHQDYHKNNPLRYKIYRAGSGRDTFLNKIWGDELKSKEPLNKS